MGGKWPDWMEWPGWLLALVYLSCVLVLMVVVEIVHLLVVKPIADTVLSSVSRAARRLVDFFFRPRPVTRIVSARGTASGRATATGVSESITGTLNVHLEPLKVTASGQGA